MATELKGEWLLTDVKKSGEVVGKTASYKINNKEAIKLTNLSPSLKVSETDGTIAGLTVDDENKTLTLSGSALAKANVAYTSSTYALELDNVPAVEITPADPVFASGKATFNGDLSEGYTLSANGKTLTYSQAKTDQLLATVTGLATTANAENVQLSDGVITLGADALKQAKVSLTLKNGAAYTLAIDSDVDKIEMSGTWSTSKGTATLKGTVEQGGYAVAPDGKSVNYLKENDKEANLATVKNLKDGFELTEDNVETSVDENGNLIINLPEEALNAKNVTLSGTGYALALDGVTTSETVEKRDEWTVSGTTATYNQVLPEHYDVSGTSIVYTKAATVQTYATVKGLKSGLKVSADKTTIQSDSTDVITVEDKKIILQEGALNTAGVTLTSDDYSLALDDVTEPEIDEGGTWALSGKNGGVYKANITKAGWGQKDDHTVTYAKVSNGAVVGTITGLKSGLTAAELNNEETGIKVEPDAADGPTFTVPKEMLTNTDVVLTNGNGFSYILATDAAMDSGDTVHSWEVADVASGETATAKLYHGKSAYFTASEDGKTLNYNNPDPGTSVATLQFLKAGTKADLLPTDEEIAKADRAKNYTIPLSAAVLDKKSVTLTGAGYELGLKADDVAELTAKENQLIWKLVSNEKGNTNATLSTYKTEGWAPNNTKTQITYTAPVVGATVATLTGFKNGLKTAGDDKYAESGETTVTRVYNNFLTGIVVYTEATTETITANKNGDERDYVAKTIAIEKAAVSDEINLKGNAGYTLGVGKDLVESEESKVWDVDKNGAAVYTYQTPAGYSIVKSGTTTTFTAEKAKKSTATITGLTVTTKETLVAAALKVDEAEQAITLTGDVLGDAKVTIKGNYHLELDPDSVPKPELGDPTWDMSKKGTAVLKGSYDSGGYTIDTKGTTVTYTKPDDQTKVTLATVSGLNTIANQADTTGLAVDGQKIVLSLDVLNKTKVTIKSDHGYTLALADDDNIPKEAKETTDWVVSGTNANYQSYKKGFYSPEVKNNEETGAAINYTKDTKATVKATVSGLLKGTTSEDVNANYEDKTLTLTADMLGTAAKVTLTDKDSGGYKLALGGDVQKTGDEVTEWVKSGTKATYQTYTKAHYTISGNTVTYNKPGKATVHLTLSGVLDDITESNMDKTKGTVTLNADQLNHGKNKVTTKLTTSKEEDYKDYKIVLAKGVSQPNASDATWSVDGKGKANYLQPVEADTFVNDGTTVTYYADDTNLTLATLSGVNKNITDDDFNGGGATVKDGVITLTKKVLQTDDNKSTKVSVSKGYTLAIDSNVKPSQTTPEWNFEKLKNGTATYITNLGAGYNVDKNATSVSYSAAKDATALITLSGLKKVTGYENATAAEVGIEIDGDVVTLSNADFLTTSKITLKNGTGANYTLTVDDALNPQPLQPDTAVWAIKSGKASLYLGESAGYKADANGTTVNYIKEDANEEIATLAGLGKNAKVEGGKLGTVNSSSKAFTQGVFIRAGSETNSYDIALTPEVVGTSDVVLKNTEGSAYTYNLTADNLTPPNEGEKIWQYDATKGAANLYQSVVAGWTLNSADNTLEYTAGKDNAVLTTFSGLSKTFNGDIYEALSTPEEVDDVITVKKASILGTGTASLKNAKDYKYELELGSDIPSEDDSKIPDTKWITSGAKASYKKYNPAYYTLNNKGAIVYNKPKDISVYAEVSGIAKDVDINNCFSGDISEGVITLGKDQLADKTVTLTNKKVDNTTTNFTLALGTASLKATPEAQATWATKNTTANLTADVSAGYTVSNLKLTYSKAQSDAIIAVVKGVVSGALNGDTLPTSNKTISLATDELSSVVTIDGKENFGFSFDNEFTGKITGAATADTITAAGDNVTIVAGKGDDSIVVTGKGSSIIGGAGNDSIKGSTKGNTTFYYAAGDGDDVIASFTQASDKIMTNAKANTIAPVEKVGSDAVITIGAGAKNEGKITLTGKGSAVSSISIVDTKGATITPSYAAASDVLLADNNYSQDAAALTDITDAFHASYTPYDFEAGLDLVKKDSFTPVVSYTGDDK